MNAVFVTPKAIYDRNHLINLMSATRFVSQKETITHKDRMISITWSKKHSYLLLFVDVHDFPKLITDGDIHNVNEPLFFKECSDQKSAITCHHKNLYISS
jgi:hypothetical protein